MTRPARVGDFIRIDAHVARLHPRLGQVLETFEGSEPERYWIRWDDDSESLFFPSRPVEIVVSLIEPENSEGDDRCIGTLQPIEVEGTATLRQVAETMTAAHRAAVIVHDLDRVTGVITEHDITQALATGADPDELQAGEILKP